MLNRNAIEGMLMFLRPSLVLLSLVLTLSLFQVLANPPTDARARLEQRVNAYFTALKINDLATVYSFESGAQDGSLTADLFYRLVTQSGGRLIDYKIEGIEINDNTATVKAEVTYEYPQLHKPYTRTHSSQWIMIDNQWFRKSAPIPPMMR